MFLSLICFFKFFSYFLISFLSYFEFLSLNWNVSPFLEKLLLFLERNSFDFDLFGYYTMQAHEFFYDSNLIDVKISENKMKSFLERNSDIFSNIGNILVKKIIHSEGNKINE